MRKNKKKAEGDIIPGNINDALYSLFDQQGRQDAQNMQPIRSNDLAYPYATINPNFKTQAKLQGATKLPKGRKQVDYSSDIAYGLAGIDTLMKTPKQPAQYVRPTLGDNYNADPYGNGSQAIMKKGGKMKFPDGGLLDPKPKKGKGPTIPVGFSKYSGAVDDQGKTQLNYNNDQWIHNMSEYMKNNNPDSNVYRPEYQHHSFDVMPEQFPQLMDNKIATPIAANGATINGNGLQTFSGGSAPKTSSNMIDGGMGEFRGASHEDGGIKSIYGGNQFEAEGGEPYRIDSQGQLEIFGNLKNPLTGSTFKKDGKAIASKEQKLNKYVDRSAEVLDSAEPTKDPFELMKFNAGKIMLQGTIAKQKELAIAKNHLSTLQKLVQDNPSSTFMREGGVIKKYAEGGKPGDPDPRDKFDALKAKVLAKLKEKYGSNVDVKYNDLGTARSIGQQQDISTRHNISPSYGMHNLDAARDFNITIDGKPAAKSVYKEVLHPMAKADGLYNLAASSDPYHISLVPEGQGHSFSDLKKKYPNYLDLPGVKENYDSLRSRAALGKVTKAQLNAYRQLSGDKGDYNINPVTNTGSLKIPDGKTLDGEGLIDVSGSKIIDKNLENLWGPENNYKPAPVQEVNNIPGAPKTFSFKNPTNNFKPYQDPLKLSQIAPEIVDLASNKIKPVHMQSLQPDLYSPYSVSFQDRRDRNTSQLRSSQQALAYDPTSQAAIAGQAYEANNSIDGEEFRTNQSIYNDIINKNVGLLNATKEKNLALADNQYVRQSQATTNTKNRSFEALQSITTKMNQNDLENKNLAVTQNAYKDYTWNPDSMQLEYVGVPAKDQISPDYSGNSTIQPTGIQTKTEVTKGAKGTSTKTTFDNRSKYHFSKGGNLPQSTISKLMYN